MSKLWPGYSWCERDRFERGNLFGRVTAQRAITMVGKSVHPTSSLGLPLGPAQSPKQKKSTPAKLILPLVQTTAS